MLTFPEAAPSPYECDNEADETAINAQHEDETEGDERRKAVRIQVRNLGFADADADQVTDDCLDAWDKMVSDPANSNKPELTLAGFVVNRCRVEKRALARARAREAYNHENVMAARDIDPMARAEPMKIDVQSTLAQLSNDERRVCEGLMRDMTQEDIAELLGVTRYAVRSLIDGIRERFTALGLDGWLTK